MFLREVDFFSAREFLRDNGKCSSADLSLWADRIRYIIFMYLHPRVLVKIRKGFTTMWYLKSVSKLQEPFRLPYMRRSRTRALICTALEIEKKNHDYQSVCSQPWSNSLSHLIILVIIYALRYETVTSNFRLITSASKKNITKEWFKHDFERSNGPGSK